MSAQKARNAMTVEEAARKLAEANARAERSVVAVYWFPHREQVRLVEIDSLTAKTDSSRAQAIYFSPLPGDIDYPMGIALLRPEETDHIKPPVGWGSWDKARLIWSRGKTTRSSH